jgi:sugar O-acyltransferase (sialic acid O-acetyltransferase NeuD family)
MVEIVVLGGSGHAKVLISVLKKADYRVIGYVDPIDHGTVLGVPWLGEDEILSDIRSRHPECLAAIGLGKIEAGSGRRWQLHAQLQDMGFIMPPIISPHAVVNEDVELGAATVVFDGAVINSGTQIGQACIINTNSTVEHDCRIGDNVHISPGANLSGGVLMGDHCMVGIGANIIQGISVISACLIGAGATVVNDLVEPGIYLGAPAFKLKRNKGNSQ